MYSTDVTYTVKVLLSTRVVS